MSRPRRTWPQRGVLVLNVVLIVACLGLAALFRSSYDRAAAINRYQLSGALTPVDSASGEDVLNVLLVGSDSAAGLDPDDPVHTGRAGERNGDVIIIAHLDQRSDTAALLSFPRDLWVPIAGTGSNRKINAAFGVGGAETLIDTIEERFGIPINHYVQVDFAGFRSLVDAVGSVPVWFDQPARDWNPAERRTQTGFRTDVAGCVELEPEQALAYVRSRYYQTQGDDGRWHMDPRGDLGRIDRQQDFLRRLVTRAVDRGARNPFTLRQLIDVALERVTIDQELTPNDLLDLGRRFSDFDPGELATYTVPVVDGTVGSASVLFAQDEQLEPVLALFRGAPIDDPSTVRVLIEHPASSGAAEVADARQRLEDAGYVVASAARSQAAGEATAITVRHAPEGSAAAQALAATLGSDVAVVEDDLVQGRDVVVVLPDPDRQPEPDGSGPPTSAPAPGSEQPTTSVPAQPGTPPPGADGPTTTVDPALACR